MNVYSLLVLAAGCCWGCTGLFNNTLISMGFTSVGIVIIRCGVASLCFAILIALKDIKQFKIKPRDIWMFLGSGLLSLLSFSYCYSKAIYLAGVSVSSILLYTSPTMVTILSVLIFKEKITIKKVISIVISFLGCVLVSGVFGSFSVITKGILYGLGSGLAYALYTIFSRFALKKGYGSNTINFYSCLLASVGAIVVFGVKGTFENVSWSVKTVLLCLVFGAVSCFLPYMLYTRGLIGLENSKASILASTEPIVACLIGFIVYKEKPDFPAIIGMILVLFAILILDIDFRKKSK